MVTFSIFFKMNVYCVFPLESTQRGDSNEYTQNTISQYKKENHPKLNKICNYRIWFMGPKNEFETAMVNEPSVFEALIRWLVGCFGLNGPLRQYFSLYRAVSQREGERKEK